MKVDQIRNLSVDEQQAKLGEMRQELFNLHFQHETGQLENPQKIKQARKAIARIMTVMRESTAQ